MKPELLVRCGLLVVLVATVTGALAEDFKPGVQHICIPNAARDGWDCGTVDNPPKPALPEEEVVEEVQPAPAPPPFLMNPDGPSAATDIAEAEPEPEPLPADPEPVVTESTAAANEPSVSPETTAVAEETAAATATPSSSIESAPLADPIMAETESLPEPEATSSEVSEPAPIAVPPAAEEQVAPAVSETIVAPEPEPEALPEPTPAAAEVAVETSPVQETPAPAPTETMSEPEPLPVSEPAPAPVVESKPAPSAAAPPSVRTPAPTGKLFLASLQGARAFAQLPASEFTLQLAYAASAEKFPALIEQLGIDHRQCYVLRVRRDNGDWWVLAYGSFADVNAAKAALMQIRPAPGMAAVWPRRVGYLQGEYKR